MAKSGNVSTLIDVNDQRLSRRVISIKDIVRLVLRSAVETGTPLPSIVTR